MCCKFRVHDFPPSIHARPARFGLDHKSMQEKKNEQYGTLTRSVRGILRDILCLQLTFPGFGPNFVASYDAINCTTQSSKHDLACISSQFSVLLRQDSMQHTLHILYRFSGLPEKNTQCPNALVLKWIM